MGIQLFSLGAMVMLVAGCATVDALDPGVVEYTFSLDDSSATTVRVTLRTRGNSNGTTRFEIAASWAGIDHCERFVHDFTVRDASGRKCLFRTEPLATHGWTAEHEPNAVLIAEYELRPSGPNPLAENDTRYEPVVRSDLFLLIGEMGLVFPKRLNESGPVDIHLHWKGFREQGWTTVSSFGDDEGKVRLPLPAFRNAVFMAGRVRVHDRQMRGGRLRVATYGEDWPFTDQELVDLIEGVVTTEREFVSDFTDPCFLVTAVPAGPRATPHSLSLAGIRLTNSFALFLAPGTLLRTDPVHREHVLRQIAHECFHTWNGGTIVFKQPEEASDWFSEGFTEFYASRLLQRAGLIDNATWVRGLNQALERLWLSPVATEPMSTLVRDYWSSHDLQLLTLLRGEIIALMLDEEIRRVSGGVKSLDHFFLEILAAARNGAVEDTESLLARMKLWTSPAFAETLQQVVMEGALPSLPASVTQPQAERFFIESKRPIPQYRLTTGETKPR